jgi:putative membrane protein
MRHVKETRQDVVEIITMSRKRNPQIRMEEEREGTNIVRDLARFALVRTAFSSERSLMAWIRTSVSLYTFGFSIATFAGHLQQRSESAWFLPNVRRLSLVFICLGILSLMLAAVEHVSRLRRMKELGLPRISRNSLPMVASVLLLAIGLVTLIGVVLKWSL